MTRAANVSVGLQTESARFTKGLSEATAALEKHTAMWAGKLDVAKRRFDGFASKIGQLPMFAAVGAAIGGIGVSLNSMTSAAIGAERQQMKLEGLLRATGGAAGWSARQIEDFAVKLGKDTLASTQEVRDAAGILLTFKAVAGEAFGRTLELAQDLAEAGFGTLAGNATQLGKALESPATGLSALTKSGVSFTVAQKE